MKYWYLYILATLLALIVVSCSEEEMEMRLSTDSTEVYVSVMLNTSGGGEMTRATLVAPGDGNPALEMQEGLDYENAINAEDVELFVFSQDGKFVEKVLITWHTSGTWYGVLNTISQEDVAAGKHFHIVALCNHKGALAVTDYTPDVGTSLDSFIEKLSFSGYTEEFTKNLTKKDPQGADVSPSSTTYIPMWGIKSVQFAGQGLCTNVGEINVLRAMAKVRVAIGGQAQTEGFTLNGCTLNVANQKGYLAAQNSQAYVESTTADGVTTYTTAWNTDESATPSNATPITTPSIYQETTIATISTPLPFSKVTEEGKSCYVIYIPEYNHVKDGEETPQSPATINLSITQGGYEVKDQNGNNYSLHFADYSNSTTPTSPEWDIIRNDIYDYTITRIESGSLQANVRVMPWKYERMEYELSQAPVVTIGWSEGWPVCYDGINYGVPACYENEGYYATFYVDVSIPEGVKWQAHLTNPIDFEFDPAFANYGYAHISNDEDAPTDYYGNKAERVTVKVRPKGAFRSGVRRITNLYFTLETLVGADKKATIKWWADNTNTKGYYDSNQVLQGIEGNGLFPMLGDADDPPGEGKMVRIVQISESEWEGYRYANLDSWKEQQYQAEQAANE